MTIRFLSLGLLSLAVLLLPAAWNVYGSTRIHDWRASPRFDGQAYLLSTANYVPMKLDHTGVAAVIATFQTWSGTPTTESQVHDLLQSVEFDGRLADFADLAPGYGLDGRWLRAEPAALSQLKLPFIAHLRDNGGRFGVVREARGGFVHVTDPLRGNVLYPLERFIDGWTGMIFAFPDPPAQPEEWR